MSEAEDMSEAVESLEQKNAELHKQFSPQAWGCTSNCA